MYRECEVCKDKIVQFTRPTSTEGDKSVVVWAEWVTETDEYKKGDEKLKVKRVVKQIQRGTSEELKQAFIHDFAAGFSIHVFNLRHQFREYKHIKESLRAEEAVLHVDFSENWTCKHATEIQACHFGGSQKQVTLHTGVAYTSENFWSFATISESLQHGPSAIWASLEPVLRDLRTAKPEIKDIHFFQMGRQPNTGTNTIFFSSLLKYITWGSTAGRGISLRPAMARVPRMP
jgi:hypothetical protein